VGREAESMRGEARKARGEKMGVEKEKGNGVLYRVMDRRGEEGEGRGWGK